MGSEDLESWQVESIQDEVVRMRVYFNHLIERMNQKHFGQKDRMRIRVEEAAVKLQHLWVDLHYQVCDLERAERQKFGERKKKPN